MKRTLFTFRRFITSDQKVLEFKANTPQLISLVQSSLYGQESSSVFIRELVSNALDATALQQPQRSNKIIKINTCPTTCLFSITDEGIGLSKSEMISLLGSIASSSKNQKNENESIGKFGLGFYSSFMVADQVTVTSRQSLNECPAQWISKGGETFSVSDDPSDVPVGTTVSLQLKKAFAKEFTDTPIIRKLVQKYHPFASFPITVNGHAVERLTPVWRTAASVRLPGVSLPSLFKSLPSALQTTHKKLYRYASSQWDTPLFTIPISGAVSKGVVYVPSRKHGFMGTGEGVENEGLLINVKGVLVGNAVVLPAYLRFITGILEVDTELKMDRSGVLDASQLKPTAEACSLQILDHLSFLSKANADNYMKQFWPLFGNVLKEGVIATFEQESGLEPTPARQKILDLLRFPVLTNTSDALQWMSLEQIAGVSSSSLWYSIVPKQSIPDLNNTESTDSLQLLRNHPHVQMAMNQKYPVMLLEEGVDEFMVEHLKHFKDRALTCVSELAVSNKLTSIAELDRFDALVKYASQRLHHAVSRIELVNQSHSYAATMQMTDSPTYQRLLAMIPKDAPGHIAQPKPLLLLNTSHPVIQNLASLATSQNEETLKRIDQVLRILLWTAQVGAGMDVDPRPVIDSLNRGGLLERLRLID